MNDECTFTSMLDKDFQVSIYELLWMCRLDTEIVWVGMVVHVNETNMFGPWVPLYELWPYEPSWYYDGY